ncbi:MAG: low specificity L-threonine aldolase [Rhodothermaceae bacterium]
MNKIIDLRSDTVTKPCEGMRKAMYDAEVGDDVYKEDVTINRLEKMMAELLGKEEALFVPTGVMGNQICLNVLTSPSDEVICHKEAHIFHFESGSPAALSGIQMLRVEGENGIMNPEEIEYFVRPESAYYMPRTRVIAVENTHNMCGGIVQPIERIKEIGKVAEKHNLYYHMDGARLWNASVAAGISMADYCEPFDTVSVCLSKGLGTPIGSVIAGSKGVMQEAFRVRKGWGGGMRQVGILGAAAIYAIENNFERMKDDHRNAKTIAETINKLDAFEIDLNLVQTNILIFKPTALKPEEVLAKCKERGLIISTGQPRTLRIVTHKDASEEDIKTACEIFESEFA